MVRADVEQTHDEQLQRELSSSVWSQCASWYRQADGRITTNWPRLGRHYRKQAVFRSADFEPDSAEVEGAALRFRTGAGIVADSDPVRELDETRAKARGMLQALSAPAVAGVVS